MLLQCKIESIGLITAGAGTIDSHRVGSLDVSGIIIKEDQVDRK